MISGKSTYIQGLIFPLQKIYDDGEGKYLQ